jgi:hypothetical protein
MRKVLRTCRDLLLKRGNFVENESEETRRGSFVFKVGVTAAVTVCVHKVFNSAGGFLRHLLFSVDEMVYGVRLNMAAGSDNMSCLMQQCPK